MLTLVLGPGVGLAGASITSAETLCWYSCSQAAWSIAGAAAPKSISIGKIRLALGPTPKRRRAYALPPHARISMRDQSAPPKQRANVSSSVTLGSGELPGWVWTQIRPNRSGARPRSTCSSKKSAIDSSSKRTVATEQHCFTRRKSSMSSRFDAALMPNPPISVGPASRRKRSLAQAYAVSRRGGAVWEYRCVRRSVFFGTEILIGLLQGFFEASGTEQAASIGALQAALAERPLAGFAACAAAVADVPVTPRAADRA